MAEPRAGIKIGLDTTDLERQIDKLNDTFKGSFGELRAAWGLVGDIGGTIAEVAEAFAELASEAEEAARVQRQATTLLVDTGRMQASELEALRALNDERERALGIDGDAQIELQTRLRLAGVHNEQLDEATRLSIGLAAVTGQDLASAMRAVEQAYDGNFKLLNRLGFEVRDANELHGLSAQLYKAAEAEATTYGGQVQRLEESFGHLREQLGSLVSESPTVKDALGQTADGVRSIGDAIDTIRTPFEWYLQGLAKLVDAWKFFLGLSDLQSRIRAAILPNLDDLSLTSADIGAALGVGDGEQIARSSPRFRSSRLRGPGRTAPASGPASRGRAAPSASDLAMDDAMARMLSDESFAAPSTTNGAFFSDPFFPAGADGQTTTDDGGAMRDALRTQYEETMGMSKGLREELAQLASTGINTLADGLSSLFVALAEGSDSTQSLGRFFGGLISMLGTMLIQLGTAAIMAGALGTAVPLFAGLAGPQAVAIGGVLVAGGIGMKAVGALLGGGGGAGGSSAPAVPRASGPGPTRPRNDGSTLGPGSLNNSAAPVVYNLNFNAPIMGSPRSTARAFRDTLREGDLRPTR